MDDRPSTSEPEVASRRGSSGLAQGARHGALIGFLVGAILGVYTAPAVLGPLLASPFGAFFGVVIGAVVGVVTMALVRTYPDPREAVIGLQNVVSILATVVALFVVGAFVLSPTTDQEPFLERTRVAQTMLSTGVVLIVGLYWSVTAVTVRAFGVPTAALRLSTLRKPSLKRVLVVAVAVFVFANVTQLSVEPTPFELG